jgi:hypothetical protein
VSDASVSLRGAAKYLGISYAAVYTLTLKARAGDPAGLFAVRDVRPGVTRYSVALSELERVAKLRAENPVGVVTHTSCPPMHSTLTGPRSAS